MPSFNEMKQLAITPNEFATLSQEQKDMPGVSINQGELMLMQNADNDGYHVYVGANGRIENFSVDTNGNAANGLTLQQILQENELRQLDFANFKRKIEEQQNFLASQEQGLPAPLTPESVQAMNLPSEPIRLDQLPPPPQNFTPTALSYTELPDEASIRTISPNQNNVTVSEDKKEIDLDSSSWTHIAAENEKPLTPLEEADISVRFANTYDKLKDRFLAGHPEFSKTAEGTIVKGNPPQELSGEDLDKFAKFYNANVQAFGNKEFEGSGFDPKFSNLDPAQMNVVQNAQAPKMQMETTNETPKPSTSNNEQTPSPSPTPKPESSQQPSPKELKKAIKESTQRVKELKEGIEDTKNSIKQLDSQIEATRDQGIMGMIKREYLAQQRWKQVESLAEQEKELNKEAKKLSGLKQQLYDATHPQHQQAQQTQTTANAETPVLTQSTTSPNPTVKIPEPIANLSESEIESKMGYVSIPNVAQEVDNTPSSPVSSVYQAIPAQVANSPTPTPSEPKPVNKAALGQEIEELRSKFEITKEEFEGTKQELRQLNAEIKELNTQVKPDSNKQMELLTKQMTLGNKLESLDEKMTTLGKEASDKIDQYKNLADDPAPKAMSYGSLAPEYGREAAVQRDLSSKEIEQAKSKFDDQKVPDVPEVPNIEDDGIIKPTRPVPSVYQALPAHAANSPAPKKEMSYGSLAPEYGRDAAVQRDMSSKEIEQAKSKFDDQKVPDVPEVPNLDDETQLTGYNVMPSSEATVINSSSPRPVFENPKPKGYSNLDLEEAEQKEISAIKDDVVPYSTVTYETLLADKQYTSLSAEDVKQEGGYQSLPANMQDNTPNYASLPTQEIDKAIMVKPNELSEGKEKPCLNALDQVDGNKPITTSDMKIVGQLTQQQQQQEQRMENTATPGPTQGQTN